MKEIENYCRTTIPKGLAGKGEKATFRQISKWFSIKNGQLYCKESRIFIADKDRQVDIIHDIHAGSGDTTHPKAMSAHFGRTQTYIKIAAFSLIWDLQWCCGLHTKMWSLPKTK